MKEKLNEEPLYCSKVQAEKQSSQPKTELNKLYQASFWFLLFIVLAVTFYFAKDILLPIIISTFIALLCSPLVNYLQKIGVPRTIGVLCVIFCMVGLLCAGISVLIEPAQQWWLKLPELVKDLSQEITSATSSDSINAAISSNLVSDSNVGEFKNNTLLSLVKSIAIAAPSVLTQVMIALFMSYFMLTYGRQLFTGFLMQFDSFSNKRKTVDLIRAIQKDISRYISTVTLINLGLGIVVGCVFFLFGIEDPFLWGAIAAVLNFAPYLGPLISMICFAVITYVQFDSASFTFIIISTYLLINMIESQFITPTLLGKRFNLNPLVIFIWLILWGWGWGSMGMLIGVPLLVCLSTLLEGLDIFGRSHLILRER